MIRTTAALLLGLLVLTGCSSASDPSPPSGVDELVIPTPSPDPADFVDGVDNPWLALTPGETVTFRVPGGPSVELRVTAGPDVAGVATTAVTLGADTDYFAQDRDGNVWWFGRAARWQAGQDGARAGLVMAATPRVGDGYRRAEVTGSDLRAEVVEVEDDVVVLDVTTDGVVSRQTFRRGVGLVLQETTGGAVELERDDASSS